MQSQADRPLHIFALSASNENTLNERIQAYTNYLEKHPTDSIGDISYTANNENATSEYRIAVIVNTATQLLTNLKNKEYKIVKIPATKPKIAFMFPGQGSQYPNMGRQVYDCQPTFKQALDKCGQILDKELGIPLMKLLQDQEIYQTGNTQPALFAFEYGLAQLWKSWGILPDLVIGHSAGEYIAAVEAGMISLEEGLKLIVTRGRLMQALPAGGGMAAIVADEKTVRSTLDQIRADVDIGAFNGPKNIVLSGKQTEVDRAIEVFLQKGFKKRRLYVSHASHSRLMDPMLENFRKIVETFKFNPPKIGFISNLTGKIIGSEGVNADYWIQHIRKPVQFAKGMEETKTFGCDIFLECGPSPILVEMGKECLPGESYTWLASMKRGLDDWPFMMESLATLYLKGFPVNWQAFDVPFQRKKVSV